MRFFWLPFLLLTLLSGVCTVTGQIDCDAQCTDNDRITWEPVVNESAYVRDPQSLDQADGRPLGFQSAILDYTDNEDPRRPCITITGCNDKRLEIMVETDPAAMICIEDVSNDAASRISICSDQRIYNCQRCPAAQGNNAAVEFQFFCSGQSCDQTAVNFWYRFVLSEPDEERYCDSRNADEYPSSLGSAFPVPAARITTEPPSGRGSNLAATLPALLGTLLMVIIVRLR